MTLGSALFASVILVLAVYNKPFRRVLFWVAGVGAVLAILFYGGAYGVSRYQERAEEKRRQAATAEYDQEQKAKQKRQDDCVERLKKTGDNVNVLDALSVCLDDPDATTMWVPVPEQKFDYGFGKQQKPKPIAYKHGKIVGYQTADVYVDSDGNKSDTKVAVGADVEILARYYGRVKIRFDGGKIGWVDGLSVEEKLQ